MSPAAAIVRQARLLACATQFLTRLPTPRLAGFTPEWIDRSARYFPLVGQLVGVLCGGVWLLAGRLWPGLPAATLALGAGALITGGFHEDGLADTADGLGGGGDAGRRLAIMKDSRIGTYGALALGLVTALRVALLAGLAPLAGLLALVLAHGAGRAAAVVVMASAPYAGDPRDSKILRSDQPVRWPEAAFAVASGVWPLVFLHPARIMLAVLFAAAAAATLALVARRLIGGITGDVLGAVEQLAEVGVLLGVAAGTGGGV